MIAAALMTLGCAFIVETPLLAQEAAGGGNLAMAYLGAAIGLGMVVIGAGLGIGRFAAAAAESIARQPAAADKITGAVNLPLFLLEGVAIIGEVGILLVVLK
jgi:F-type H+-transporting ATPase subunit c